MESLLSWLFSTLATSSAAAIIFWAGYVSGKAAASREYLSKLRVLNVWIRARTGEVE